MYFAKGIIVLNKNQTLYKALEIKPKLKRWNRSNRHFLSTYVDRVGVFAQS